MYEIIESIKALLTVEGYDQLLPESISDVTNGLIVNVSENIEESPSDANNIANHESESYTVTLELVYGDIENTDTEGETARKKQLDSYTRDIKLLLTSNAAMDSIGADLIIFSSGYKNYTYMDCSYISTASISFRIQSGYANI